MHSSINIHIKLVLDEFNSMRTHNKEKKSFISNRAQSVINASQ